MKNYFFQLNNEKLEKLKKINQLEEELRMQQDTSLAESEMFKPVHVEFLMGQALCHSSVLLLLMCSLCD